MPNVLTGRARWVAGGVGGGSSMAGIAGASGESMAGRGGTARYLSRWHCRRGVK